MTDSFGLGGLSEEGLEALNKNIRNIRSTDARKDNTVRSLWIHSTTCGIGLDLK